MPTIPGAPNSGTRSVYDTLKDLIGHSAIFSLAMISNTIIGIILLPIYTRFLNKTDYGLLEILDYVNIILQIVAFTGLNAAVPRFYNADSDPAEQKKVVSTSAILVIVAGAVVCFAGYLLRDGIALLTLGNTTYSSLVTLSVAVLYSQTVVSICVVALIASKKTKVYLTYMLVRLGINLAANLFFVVVLRLGATGMLYGNLLANGLIAATIMIHTLVSNGIGFRMDIARRLYSFGAPLIPATIMATLIHNSDRFLIRYFCSLDDVGIYSLGYRFPFLLNALILHSIGTIWGGTTMYDVSRQTDSSYQYSRITTYIISLFVTAQLALSLFAMPIVKILADPKFFDAHQVIPIVAFGLCFHAFDTFFSVGVYLKSKTYLRILAYFPAAGVNILGNIYFLPKYGYMASAWISAVTYIIFAAAAFITSRHLHRISFEVKRIFMVFAAAVVIFLLSSLLRFENLYFEIIKSSCFVGVYIITLYISGWLTSGEKAILKDKYDMLRRLGHGL